MIVQPLDYVLVVWFVLAGLCTAYVAWDQFRNNPEPAVMKWGFALITLYMGPLGLLLYVLADKENFVHPMHVHGGPFEVVAVDGVTPAPTARYWADTVNVGPGQRYDVVWTARRPGRWLVHCHIPHHTTNNNVERGGGGGLTMILDVR